MTQIKALSTENPQEVNQLVRWVTTKEDHANKIQDVVYQYFMNQRIKPVDEGDGDAYTTYVNQLTLLHKMLTESMKCKQTVDPVHVENLKSLVAEFEKSYFAEAEHEHK
jgi:nickel superoxide dismutase